MKVRINNFIQEHVQKIAVYGATVIGCTALSYILGTKIGLSAVFVASCLSGWSCVQISGRLK